MPPCKDVIGCSTVKTYFKKVDFYNKLDKCTEKLPPHINNTYRAETILYSQYSFSEISNITKVTNRATIKAFLTFQKNRDTETLVMQEVEDLLSVIKYINPIRNTIIGKEGKKDTVRIYDFKYIKPTNDWDLLHKSRGDWFVSKTRVNRKIETPIFLPKAKLHREIENTTNKEYLSILEWSVKYLDYLDSLHQKKIRGKVVRLTDSDIRSNYIETFSKEKQIKLEVVNF